MPSRKGTAPTNDDGRPQSTYIVRFRNVTDKHPDFIRGYGFQGASGSADSVTGSYQSQPSLARLISSRCRP